MPHDHDSHEHCSHRGVSVQGVETPQVVIAEQEKHKFILTVDLDNHMEILFGVDVSPLQVCGILADTVHRLLAGYADPSWGPATPHD